MNIYNIPIGEGMNLFANYTLVSLEEGDIRLKQESDYDLKVFYQKETDFEHLFQFEISAKFISRSPNTLITFIISPAHRLIMDGKFEFNSPLDLRQIGAIYDLFLECLRGAYECATNALNTEEKARDIKYPEFTERQILDKLNGKPLNPYIHTTSFN